MRKLGLALSIGVLLMAVSLLPVSKPAAASVGVEVGDYWKYEAGADVEGMGVDITMKMKVTGTEGSGASEVFVISMTGSGDVSGTYSGITVSGSVDYSGEMKRLKSNLSLTYQEVNMEISIKVSGQTMKMSMGVEQTFSPAMDDYIGDDNPGHGATIESRSTVTSTTSMKIEIPGLPAQTEEETTTDDAELTIVIAGTNSTVEVPAGEFDCYKYTYTLEMGGMTEMLTYYYSDEVGNFVKQEGTMDIMGGFGNSELTSYSFGGSGSGGTSSLFSGTNLLIIIVIIVAIIVVVSLVLLMRKRGKAAVPMPPPMMGAPPPPPPPSA